jgi:hypothetical protein
VTGLPVTQRGHDAILTVVDRLTKLTVLIPTQTTCDAKEFAYLMTNHVFAKYGVPADIVSDRGTIFTGRFWAEVTQIFSITRRLSTAYHPQSDGNTEVINKLTEQVLRAHVNPRQDDWDEFLGMVEFAINNSLHSSLRHTPFFLNYGTHPATPVMLEALKQSKVPAADHFSATLHDVLKEAKQNLLAAQDRQRSYVNAKRKDISFQVGDKVLLSTSNLHPKYGVKKLWPKWVGPFPIVKAVSEVAYKLQLPGHMKVHDVFHVSLLKPFHSSLRMQPPMPVEVADGFEWEVEAILLHRQKQCGKRSKTEYFVKWARFGPEHSTWEPEGNLTNCSKLLSLYWKQYAELQANKGGKHKRKGAHADLGEPGHTNADNAHPKDGKSKRQKVHT